MKRTFTESPHPDAADPTKHIASCNKSPLPGLSLRQMAKELEKPRVRRNKVKLVS